MVHKKSSESTETTRSPRHRWKISFYRSSSSITAKTQQQEPKKMLQTPKEFLCPISGSLMADPVIVSSGHTFERACVHACKTLGFTPALVDGTVPDFSTVIPNLALKSTILNWCEKNSVSPPKPIDILSADKLVCTLMATTHKKEENEEKELIRGLKENPSLNFSHAVTDLTRRPGKFFAISSEVSVPTTATVPTTPPSCYSSASSSELETSTPHPQPNSEEEFVAKLKSQQVHELEEAVISLRKITRTREDSRATLCTTRLLSALRSLIISRYTNIQVNSVAALVNLSLEKANKVKIVRSGIVPPLIEVLKGGSLEAQEHACGAIFSLSLDDNNKTAIGVLGALPPLLHLLRSESERTRHDSALALYHLSLVRSNRTKLVKLGSVNVLLGMVKSGQMVGRVLIILGNLAACPDGRDYNELNESTRTSCVNVLYGLSHGGLRFRGLAKVGGMAETLRTVERGGNQQAREKARRILEMMKGRGDEEEEEEDMDWQELLESGLTSRTRFGPSTGRSESIVNSSEF
ncbi:hypothetical protein Patl1_21974 [Pistacia atlantica]|uniref:Uncharacterized protein n=1 Tax=Pistacia atlantica TaxID=434234 RepID=A0ACC1BKV7_9ROSI|nr:hypothetical protein Patl1_21974 [Pistacia atlantica]